jgi:hypothetical protein
VKERLGAALVCLVFALPFGGVGAGAAYAIAGTIRDGMAAREWVRVKAEVLSHGNGSVLYRYTMDGKSYTGDRLGTNVIGGTDNVDSWHEDMDSMLAAARSEGKPITVFVNPDDPTQSMVDNTIRWKLLVFFIPFALAFGGVGVGALFMMYKALAGDRPAVARTGPRRATPNTIASDQRGGVAMLWIFAFFWNAISFPIAFLFVPEIWASGEWIGLLVLLFPLIGVLLLWGCIAGTINYFRRGGAGLLLNNDSPRAGSTIEGAVTFPRGIAAGTPFRVRLVCNRGNVDGDGDTSWRKFWDRDYEVRTVATGYDVRLQFRFEIPGNLPGSTGADGSKARYAWRIEARPVGAATTAMPYGFDVQVRAAETAPATAPAFADDMMPAALGPNIEAMLAGAGVNLDRDQRRMLSAVPAEHRDKVVQLIKWGPEVKKWAIFAVVAYFVIQIASLLMQTIEEFMK